MIMSYLKSAGTEIIGLLINNQEILLDISDCTLQEQPKDNLMVAISRAWYNGSYTTAAMPIKSLELHYNDPVFFFFFFFFFFLIKEDRP